MYLDGYKAHKHNIYFGTSESKLKKVATRMSGKNICTPAELRPGRTYYWRVDAIRKGGVTHGKVWSFTTEQDQEVSKNKK